MISYYLEILSTFLKITPCYLYSSTPQFLLQLEATCQNKEKNPMFLSHKRPKN